MRERLIGCCYKIDGPYLRIKKALNEIDSCTREIRDLQVGNSAELVP